MQRKPETEFLSRMQSATLLVVLTLASTGAAMQLRLNCNSQLRLVLPALFAHCTPGRSCSYSEWSAWEAVPNSVVSVPTSQCRSNESYNETRTQSAIGQGCRSRTQTRSVCKYTYQLIWSSSPYPTGTLTSMHLKKDQLLFESVQLFATRLSSQQWSVVRA